MGEPNFNMRRRERSLEEIQEEAERAEADRIFFSKVKPRLEGAEKNDNLENNEKNVIDEKYRRMLTSASFYGVNVEDLSQDIGIKRKHLREIMGYNVLYGKNGKAVSIDLAEHSRIASAYRNCIYRARNLREMGNS